MDRTGSRGWLVIVLVLAGLVGLAACASGVALLSSSATPDVPAQDLPAQEVPAPLGITVDAPGLEVGEVERAAAVPLARALLASGQVRHVHARAEHGRARLHCVLAPEADAASVRRAIDERALPEDALVSLERAGRVRHVLLAGDELGLAERSARAAEVRQRLLARPDVEDAELCGARAREIVVDLDPSRLTARGLTASQVLTALGASRDAPLGTNPDARGADALGHLPELPVRGATLGDVATVREGIAHPACVAWHAREMAVVGIVREARPIDAALTSLGVRAFAAGARSTRGTIALAPGMTREQRGQVIGAMGEALGGVSGVRDVLLLDADGAIEVHLAWSSDASRV